jgi:translocation protein SEC62
MAATTSSAAATTNGDGGGYYDDVDHLKKLCDFLRSRQGPPIREALLMEKRVQYLKGEKLVNFLVEPKKGTKWPTNLPRFASRVEAISACKSMCKNDYLLRSEKRGKGELGVSYIGPTWQASFCHVNPQCMTNVFLSFSQRRGSFLFSSQVSRVRDFEEAGYYTWLYEGDKTTSHLMSAALIVGFLFCVCFPIWPQFLRVFVWYMSVTFSLVIFGLLTLRGLAFFFVWVLGYEFWIFPNLFDESLGFFDSFKPFFSFEPTKPGQLPYRIGIAVGFFSFCWWAVTQPSEFDGFVAAQGDFIKDLYAGTLLSDVSQADKENIDKPKMQSLDELLRSLDAEEKENEDFRKEVDEEEKIDSLLDNLVDVEEDVADEE